MSDSEKTTTHRIMIALSTLGVRLFRNTVGTAYQGDVERFTNTSTVLVRKGDIVVRQARTIRAGLAVGSSDTIGWTVREITEHDLGKTVAQFTAIEVKSTDGVLSTEQRQFLEVVRDSGGLAIVARSVEEATERLKAGGGIE